MEIRKESGNRILMKGRITAENVKKAEENVKKLAEAGSLTLDFGGVTYIASAGIRMILNLMRQDLSRKIVIKGVQPAVYEILEMTGVTQVLTVKKALRKVSTEGLRELGRGRSATVYRLDSDRIIKVFLPSVTEETIESENEITREAFLSGIDTMVAYDIVSTEKGLAAIYENLKAKDLISVMSKARAKIGEYTEGFASLVRASHEKTLDRKIFGDAADRTIRELRGYEHLGLDPRTAERMTEILETSVPKTDEFSHGDCHLGNIMLKGDHYQFIDVGRMSCGHKVFDLTSMFVQFRYHTYHGIVPKLVSQFAAPFTPKERDFIWNTYLRGVTGIADGPEKEKAEEQINVIAGIRMLGDAMENKDLLPQAAVDRFVRAIDRYAEEGFEKLIF